jgi:hypothetical protein
MQAHAHVGEIGLNVEGRRYTGWYRIEAGVMTVTCGFARKSIDVGYVESPESVARTVLKTMILEGLGTSTPAEADGRLRQSARRWCAPRAPRTRH